MKKLYFLSILFFVITDLTAQTAPLPEQDCMGAIRLCGTHAMIGQSYNGYGITNMELPSSICLETGENNSVWITFVVDSPGRLCFQIIPKSAVDDYDFALFDLTGHACADIATEVAPVVRCNYAIGQGETTGVDTFGTRTTTNACCDQILLPLQVTTGQQFALLINNFTTGGNGFTLDFKRSTCTFAGDSNNLHIIGIVNNIPASNSLVVEFSGYLDCSSIDTNGGNFQLLNAPSGLAIDHVVPMGNCNDSVAGVRSLTIYLNHYISNSAEVLLALNPNSLFDFCGTALAAETDSFFDAGRGPVAKFNIAKTHNDTVFVNNQALYADTVYYYVVNSSGVTYTSSSPNVIVAGNDTYQICQVAINSFGIDTFCTTYIYSGINSPWQTNNLSIYPNPTTGMLHVELPKGTGTSHLRLLDLLGVEVQSTEVGSNQSSTDMNLNNLPAATYLLFVEKDGKQTVAKVLKY